MLIGAPPLPPSFIFGVRLNSPHTDDERRVEQSAIVEVFKERRDRRVHLREVIVVAGRGPSGGPIR